MHRFFFPLLMALSLSCAAQKNEKPFVRLIQPSRDKNTVRTSRQFISGSVCKGCRLSINDTSVHVYATGGFACVLNLAPGDSSFELTATNADGKTARKKLSYSYVLPEPPDTVRTLSIESIQTFPEGDLSLEPGDKIEFKVKTLTGCEVKAGDIPLYELPVTQTKGMPGIYQGAYLISETDRFNRYRFPVTVTSSDRKSITRETKNMFSVFPDSSVVAITKGRLAYLEYGLGENRLGGAKIGYLDSNVVLNITGKIGSKYRVQLAAMHTAYIADDQVAFLPNGSTEPQSLTANWIVWGDNKFDYVEIELAARLPYQSFPQVSPSRIVVDIYGATNNTNWIKQFESVKEIKNVYYEQIEDGVYRATIELKHEQQWGYQIYYKGNHLVIKIRRPPLVLALRNLTIAVDAGHGGTNNGAIGPTGVYEKELTLAIALKLQQRLQQEGVHVIMTRTQEQFFDNRERILFYRDSLPDLLLSIHFNASEDPINVGGTSTYYRYTAFRPLSECIYKRMLELGLKEYGNTGSFNFMLNSPTEYPNALIETLFLSNPAEEEKILDEHFQQQIVDKIVQGLKDFLTNAH